ncbi:MAG: hypothetical protein JO326_07905, partial [Acetobacteraceae bacterium]|nr:hypothetical protein [Acetobacteraceae bacterium]
MLPEADAVPTTQPHPIVRLRYVERWVLAAVILTLAAAVLYVLSRADIAYRDVPGFFVYPIMLQGLWHTIVLAIAAQSAAVVVGVVIAIMRVSRNPVASWT